MKLRFSRDAAKELREISAYIRERNPEGARKVRDAIRASARMLANSPYAGRAQQEDGVRKLVMTRYPYLIYYRVNENKNEVDVLRIYHSARLRPYHDG